jgi:hypothetical protein
MTRIRRIFIAAVAATALTASMGVSPSTAARTCKVDGFKITKRHNVTCRKAKKVTHRQVSGEKLPDGWKCTNTGNLVPEGKCHKGTTKRFRYGM